MIASVLNLVPLREEKKYKEAIDDATNLVIALEEYGYQRLWVAEHHNTQNLASTSPALMIEHLLAHTQKIRIGAGGVMLPNHSPLSVAEQFAFLDTLAPKRVDLGLGRAPGTDPVTALALRRNIPNLEFNFEQDLDELTSYFDGTAAVHSYMAEQAEVPIYLLGSSVDSAHLAAKRGLPYAFASHFAPAAMDEALKIYRSEFKASKWCAKPYVIVGVNVSVADTQAQAESLFTTQLKSFLNVVTNRSSILAEPAASIERFWEEEEAFIEAKVVPHFGPVAFTAEEIVGHERAIVEEMSSVSVVGDKEHAVETFRELQRRTLADEFMLVNYTRDLEAQKKNFKLAKEAIEALD